MIHSHAGPIVRWDVDSALRDNLHLITQRRRLRQHAAKQSFAGVSPIDVGVIEGRDAALETRIDLLTDSRDGRSRRILAQTPHAISECGNFGRVRRELESWKHV